MSLLSGILSGSGLILSALGAAIDGSHHPFKRARYRPGGPKNNDRDEETKTWECTKTTRMRDGRAVPKSFVAQKCVNVKKPGNKPKIVLINKAKKKHYNKLYREGFKAKSFKSARDPVFRKDKVARGAVWKKKARRSKSKR